MKINKTIAIVGVLFGLLVGGLGAGVWWGQQPLSANAAPSFQEDADETGEVEDDDGAEDDGENEAMLSPDQASITTDEAKAAAEAEYPGAKALEVELENERGTVAYEVELDNGREVLVDPSDGSILGTDAD